MEELDRRMATVPGVRQVDVWPERVIVVAEKEEVADACVAAVGAHVASPRVTKIADAEKTLAVAGMDCRSCGITLERRLMRLPGMKSVKADADRGHVEITYDSDRLDDADVAAEIAAAGYRVGETNGVRDGEAKRPPLTALAGLLAAAAGLVWLTYGHLGAGFGSATGTAGFVTAVTVGLLAGFSSCLAVTGGLVLSLATGLSGQKRRSTAPIAAFAVGRLVSYAGFGAAIGALGHFFAPSPAVSSALMLAAAIVMLLMGLDSLGLMPKALKNFWPTSASNTGRRLLAVADRHPTVAPFLIGGATFFLPCGFTQSFQIFALSAGSAAAGASVLGGFALGTLPAIMAVGMAAASIRGTTRQWAVWAAGAILLILGIFTMRGGLALAGLGWPTGPTTKTVVADVSLPPIVDGRQVIRMTVGAADAAFSPDHFTVRAGVPVRWEIDQQATSGCLSFLVSRQLGLNVQLKPGANTVDFTADRSGQYRFSCSMGMYGGVIDVVPAS